MFSGAGLEHLLTEYGYGLVGVVVMLEAMGAPLPGESILIAGSVYAATTGKLEIFGVVGAAIAGAIMGDNFGFLIGRSLGFKLLARYGRRVGLTEKRLGMGRYLFKRHGGKVVFVGRFIAVLRTFVALLSGANQMEWRPFLMFNALGGIAWASLYGFGAYFLGNAAGEISGKVGLGLGVVAAVLVVVGIVFFRRNEARLERQLEQQMARDGETPQTGA